MSALVEFISGIITFLANIVMSIWWFVTNLPSFLSVLTKSINYAPDFLVPYLVLSVSATALFAILRLI